MYHLACRWLLAAGVVALCASAGAAPATVLGVEGSRFTLNGKPAFLYGISYYGALGASDEAVRLDLADMRRHGLNWLRVWANWAAFDNDVSAVDADGRPREPYLGKLKQLVAECDRMGLVVDVTLTRGKSLPTHAAHLLAVQTLVRALKPYRNWYLDLANERNVRDSRYCSFEELADLRQAVRREDPGRLVTASDGGDIARTDVRAYLVDVGCDFIAPHRPRNAGSPAQTEAKTRQYLAWMKEFGKEAPVHYQEPFRRGYNAWQPAAEEFAADLKAARAGGAAGWCFHNGDTRGVPEGRPRRSFDLRDGRLFDQLDSEEKRAVGMMEEIIAPTR